MHRLNHVVTIIQSKRRRYHSASSIASSIMTESDAPHQLSFEEFYSVSMRILTPTHGVRLNQNDSLSKVSLTTNRTCSP